MPRCPVTADGRSSPTAYPLTGPTNSSNFWAEGPLGRQKSSASETTELWAEGTLDRRAASASETTEFWADGGCGVSTDHTGRNSPLERGSPQARCYGRRMSTMTFVVRRRGPAPPHVA
jgi:hypothetical protein